VTQPVDITNPVIARAFAHPLRIQIMGLLDNRTASPREIASELGAPLSNTSYHVRQLAHLGLVELVGRRLRRGAVEHFYTAIVRPTIHDDTWATIPPIIKQALVGGRIGQLVEEFGEAAKAGGFDGDDVHVTRTRMTLTEEGWSEVSGALLTMLDRLDAIAKTDAERADADAEAEKIEATAVMMLFESPQPHGAGGKREALEYDELQDLVPPTASGGD
jgi:DNA-binding transcriptional ArsR family regulator